MFQWLPSCFQWGSSPSMQSSSVSDGDGSPPYEYKVTRHYYTGENRFEQSLDLYEPQARRTGVDGLLPPSTTLVLVMGSGWLGHVKWIYTWTHWWNASAPQNISSRLGLRCVAIRHSGSFVRVPPSPLDFFWRGRKHRHRLRQQQQRATKTKVLGFLATGVFVGAATGMVKTTSISVVSSSTALVRLLLANVSVVLGVWTFLDWQGDGCANMIDMVTDVANALHFLRNSPELLNTLPSSPASISVPETTTTKEGVILGGYSSGGHVVATLLSLYPEKINGLLPSTAVCHNHKSINRPNNKEPQAQSHLMQGKEDWIKGVLYISGVFSLDSWLMKLVTFVVFGCWGEYDNKKNLQPSNVLPQSPLYGPPPHYKHLRHLVVGCRQETFGIPLLDGSLCAQTYADTLRRKHQIYARCILLSNDESTCHSLTSSSFVECDVNHWTILNSRAMVYALREHLPWLTNNNDYHYK